MKNYIIWLVEYMFMLSLTFCICFLLKKLGLFSSISFIVGFTYASLLQLYYRLKEYK